MYFKWTLVKLAQKLVTIKSKRNIYNLISFTLFLLFLFLRRVPPNTDLFVYRRKQIIVLQYYFGKWFDEVPSLFSQFSKKKISSRKGSIFVFFNNFLTTLVFHKHGPDSCFNRKLALKRSLNVYCYTCDLRKKKKQQHNAVQ